MLLTLYSIISPYGYLFCKEVENILNIIKSCNEIDWFIFIFIYLFIYLLFIYTYACCFFKQI
jgi:hypothetical protein